MDADKCRFFDYEKFIRLLYKSAAANGKRKKNGLKFEKKTFPRFPT